ncbi:Uncharacterised protein [Vibrio cholerae]|nr:Uncharacterised protein [Vibrio cholerae]
MWYGDRILRSITVAKTCTAADFNERGETGPHHTRFRLVQSPSVDHGIETLVG